MLKPIETVYNGYRFRSRLEARWAVFFDTLGIKYEYEKEGYDLDGTWYLPDFWLPEHKAWVEIKGEPPTDKEDGLAASLCLHSHADVFLFFGQIRLPEDVRHDGGHTWKYYAPTAGEAEAAIWDNCQTWCECPICGRLGIMFDGRSARLGCGCLHRFDPLNDKGYNTESDRLIAAYDAAIKARFEHGEMPRPVAIPFRQNRRDIARCANLNLDTCASCSEIVLRTYHGILLNPADYRLHVCVHGG